MKSATKCRIVVADDNRDSATSLSMMLTLMGNEVRTAFDGAQAVQVAEDFQPQVVFLDLGMPVLSGYDASRKIREQSWGQAVLLVALTGWDQTDDNELSKDAGFDVHLVKPVEVDRLLQLLATLKPPSVESRPANRSGSETPPPKS
jgi:CheY-like chemotaxis protein